MKDKRIEWWTPQSTGEESAYLAKALDSHFFNEGDLTQEFEQKLAALVGAEHAVAVTSGTSALFLSVAALGIGPGDEVIVPDMTFIATANAVKLAGATPVLVDVDPSTLCIDPQSFQKAITKKTRAVIPVHVSGRAADMQNLLETASRHGIAVVEDAAEGLLSRYQGRCLGAWGDLGCLSFSPNKTITTGQGGMIFTNDADLHVQLRKLKDQGRPVRGTGGDDIHASIGFNFKFTNLQAAVGLAQLKTLEQRTARLRRHAEIYHSELAGLSGIRLLPFQLDQGEVPQWVDAIVEHRDELETYLTTFGISCRRFWHPLHTQSPYKDTDERFPNSTALSPKALWLPSAFTLSDEDIRAVCKHIQSFLTQGRRKE